MSVLLRRAAEPIFSPAGTQVAVLRTRPSRSKSLFGETTDLFTMNLDGTGLRQLTNTRNHTELFARWDPSGMRIAFNQLRPSRHVLLGLGFGDSIMQINADGSCQRQVLSLANAALYGAAWQPGPGREAGRIAC